MNSEFQEIFKKERKIIKKEFPAKKVLIDYREKNSLVPSELMALKVPIEFQNLEIADYLIEDIAIERKSLSDFISSMINKRFLKQLQNLQQCPKPLIIIEGHQKDFDFNVSQNAIRGFLLSISLSYKIQMIFTENSIETAEYINLIARKKPTNMSFNISKKNLTDTERLRFILESFPKIGPKTSEKLLKEFKGLKKIINASKEELQKVLGKKSEEIYKIIDMKLD